MHNGNTICHPNLINVCKIITTKQNLILNQNLTNVFQIISFNIFYYVSTNSLQGNKKCHSNLTNVYPIYKFACVFFFVCIFTKMLSDTSKFT